MGNHLDLVRFSNDGHDFHVLWTARRSLRLLEPGSDLRAVTIEGVSASEGVPASDGVLVVDTAEYYGAETLQDAVAVHYIQLKYATAQASEQWPASGLADTLKGFADLFRNRENDLGQVAAQKVRYSFVTNRPISDNVIHALRAARKKAALGGLAPMVRGAYQTLLHATTLDATSFSRFAAQLDLVAAQPPRHVQEAALAEDIARVAIDDDALLRMKDLIRRRATSDGVADNRITRDVVLSAFHVVENDLFPAPPRLEFPDACIPRPQEEEIAAAIVSANFPVVVAAAGGVGKTVLAQRLPTLLPAESEAVVFDGFGGGEYRIQRCSRHRAREGLVQIVNELATKGLCDILIPSPLATDREYLQAFRRRLAQASAIVRARNSEAVLLVVVDAADNVGMAAELAHEASFVPALLEEPPPNGCRMVMLARGHRVKKYLKPPQDVLRLDLQPFTPEQSGQLLRQRFPEASEDDAHIFHRFTAANPRVQANALADARDLQALRMSLGPAVKGVEELIADQLAIAFAQVEERQAVGTELRPLAAALAVLPPPAPVAVVAMAAGLTDTAVHSFVADFARGRPLLLRDDAVQFRDEPTETWFLENFASSLDHQGVAARLGAMADADSYVASVFPVLLYGAGRYEDLVRLAVAAPPPAFEDPVARRTVVRQRVQYALRAAVARDAAADIVKLLLRAAEEEAAHNRQVGFLEAHADMVGQLAAPDVVSEHVYRHRPWRERPASSAACSLMLAAHPATRAEARSFIQLASAWLNEEVGRQREEDFQGRPLRPEDLLPFAEVSWLLGGDEGLLRFMGHWRHWAQYVLGRSLATRFIDRGNASRLMSLLSADAAPLALRLAVLAELAAVCLPPSREAVDRALVELLAEPAPLDMDGFREGRPLQPAIAAVAEFALHFRCDQGAIRRLLRLFQVPHEHTYHSYDPGHLKDALLRMAAVEARLAGRDVTLDDVVPSRLRKKWSDARGDYHSDVRTFKEQYGALVPWAALRCRMLAGGDEPDLLAGLAEAEKPARSVWGWRHDHNLHAPAQDLARLRLEALLWAGELGDDAVPDHESWIDGLGLPISVESWTACCRILAQRPSTGDMALRCAHRAVSLLRSQPGEAAETAEALMAIARAVLPLGEAEATPYLEEALEELGRLGDELPPRLVALMALADRAGEGAPSPRRAHRLARAAEAFHACNSHDFPWSRVASAVAALDIPYAFAAAARWDSRGTVLAYETLPAVTERSWRTRSLPASAVVALHTFRGYWDGGVDATDLFKGLRDNSCRQIALDALASDVWLDRRETGWATRDALEGVVTRYALSGACIPAQKKARDDEDDTLEASHLDRPGTAWAREAPDWEAVLAGLDLTRADAVATALERLRAVPGYRGKDELLAEMRRRVPASQRADHVRAVAQAESGHGHYALLRGLIAFDEEWGDSRAVRKALKDAVELLIDQASSSLVPNLMWTSEDDTVRCAELSGLDRTEILRRMTVRLAADPAAADPGVLFRLAAVLAQARLSPEEAAAGLDTALDRLDPILRPEEGDGPWSERLNPPEDVCVAVAGFLYTMHASPEADTRWRAAHAVRRLCRFGESAIVAALVKRLPEDGGDAFASPRLPFYTQHARLWLMISLARAAREAPHAVAPHVRSLLDWALTSEEPHVLIRHFAAEAVRALAKGGAVSLAREDHKALERVNRSPLPPAMAEEGRRRGRDMHAFDRHGERFLLPLDFDKYWINPLGRVFNLPGEEIADRVIAWICDRWGQADGGRLGPDPYQSRRPHGARDAGRGSISVFDDHRFYLSYHALFCVAGAALAEKQVRAEEGSSAWERWLSEHSLTRHDGRWLADRRDPEPSDLGARLSAVPSDMCSKDAWPHSVTAQDLDQALGLNAAAPERLVVYGGWSERTYDRRQSVRVSSALVPPETGLALLRALQTAEHRSLYRIPTVEERGLHDDGSPPKAFRVTPWIASRSAEDGLDRRDPYAGSVGWPPPSPSPAIRRLFGLTADDDRRCWLYEGNPVLRCHAWGDDRDDNSGMGGSDGQRLAAALPFLLGMLARLDRALIIEVEIDRDNARDQDADHETLGYRWYSRLYLLRGDGRLHTLHGTRRLRPEADCGSED